MTYVDRPPPPRGGARAASTLARSCTWPCARCSTCRPPRRTRDGRRRAGRPQLVERGLPRRRRRPRSTASGPAAGSPTTPRASTPTTTPVGREQWVSVATERIVAEGRVDRIDRRGERAGGRRLQDRPPRAHRAGRRRLAARWPSTRWPPSAPCAAAARRSSCTTCPPGRCRPGGTTGRRCARTCAGPSRRPPSSPRPPTSWAAAATRTRCSRRGPAPRCGSCDVRRNCPRGARRRTGDGRRGRTSCRDARGGCCAA